MDEQVQKTEAEILEERRFIESFAYAMKQAENMRADKHIELAKNAGAPRESLSFSRDAMDELKSKGNWNDEFIAGQYVLIINKMSTLSRRLRNYILLLGSIACEYHEKHYVEPEEAAKNEKHEDSGADAQ